MAKKITVTLSDKAEQYFNELMYSLTGKDDKPATQSECINESLETLADFEKLTDDQLRNWNQNFSLHSPAERIEGDAVQEWRDECERLAGLVEFWQKKYYDCNPGFKVPKIDNL